MCLFFAVVFIRPFKNRITERVCECIQLDLEAKLSSKHLEDTVAANSAHPCDHVGKVTRLLAARYMERSQPVFSCRTHTYARTHTHRNTLSPTHVCIRIHHSLSLSRTTHTHMCIHTIASAHVLPRALTRTSYTIWYVHCHHCFFYPIVCVCVFCIVLNVPNVITSQKAGFDETVLHLAFGIRRFWPHPLSSPLAMPWYAGSHSFLFLVLPLSLHLLSRSFSLCSSLMPPLSPRSLSLPPSLPISLSLSLFWCRVGHSAPSLFRSLRIHPAPICSHTRAMFPFPATFLAISKKTRESK